MRVFFLENGPVALGLYLWVVFPWVMSQMEPHLFMIGRIPLIYTVAYIFLYIQSPLSENFPPVSLCVCSIVCSDPSIILSLQTVYCWPEKSSVVWGSCVVPPLEGSGQNSDLLKRLSLELVLAGYFRCSVDWLTAPYSVYLSWQTVVIIISGGFSFTLTLNKARLGKYQTPAEIHV